MVSYSLTAIHRTICNFVTILHLTYFKYLCLLTASKYGEYYCTILLYNITGMSVPTTELLEQSILEITTTAIEYFNIFVLNFFSMFYTNLECLYDDFLIEFVSLQVVKSTFYTGK